MDGSQRAVRGHGGIDPATRGTVRRNHAMPATFKLHMKMERKLHGSQSAIVCPFRASLWVSNWPCLALPDVCLALPCLACLCDSSFSISPHATHLVIVAERKGSSLLPIIWSAHIVDSWNSLSSMITPGKLKELRVFLHPSWPCH